jgi:replicative DNA helicase
MTFAHLIPAEDEPIHRRVPHNIEVEQALLGAILINNEAFFRVSDFLEPTHFFDPVHRQIYEKAGQLIRLNKTADPRTIKSFMKENDRVGEITIAEYLSRLAYEATTIINAQDYGRTIYDLSIRRNLITIGEDMVNIAYEAPVDMPPREQIEDAERRLFEIAETGRFSAGFQGFAEALKAAIDMAGAAYQRAGHLSGLACGLEDLDKMMGGMQNSDLIILAGRPGMGKTSLATNVAYNVAKAWRGEQQADGTIKTVDGGIVGFFSLEMSSEQLATRVLGEQARVSSADIRRGAIHEEDFDRIVEAAQLMQRIPLYIDQTGGLSVAQLAARARRLKRQRGLDLLIIDYLQLIQGTTRRSSESRVQEITEITTNLKALAKELNVPILALSQLSRQVEQREDKRPQLSDLRESGSIEQDADVVLFVFREEYYLKNRKPKEGTEEFFKWMAEMDQMAGRAEIIIGKQRHGPTGTVELQFEAEVTRFSSLAKDDHLPARYDN